MIVAILCCITCVAYIINLKLDSNELDNLKSQVSVDNSSTESKVNYVETPVDFVELKNQNPEIYAWINIPGTVVDYPILRREDDNSYYLNHTVAGKRSVSGSIYTENYNDTDFADFNTLIYGHNMKNGTMFAALKKYRDKVFFEKNRYINIYMPGRIMKYEIFAAYVWDDRHILLNFDFSDKDVRSEYIDMIYQVRKISSNIKSDITVTESDKIITLSTCTNKKEERYLVQGVLVYDSREQ